MYETRSAIVYEVQLQIPRLTIPGAYLLIMQGLDNTSCTKYPSAVLFRGLYGKIIQLQDQECSLNSWL